MGSSRFLTWFGLFGALLTAWVAMMGSLYFSEVRGFVPCTLCWYQRILMYPLALLIALGVWRNVRELPFLVLPFSLIGQGISIYHYLLQKTSIFGAPTACTSSAPCTTAWINWFGFVTIPFLAMVGFLLITLAMLLVMAANPDQEDGPNAYDSLPKWPIATIIAITLGLYAAGFSLAQTQASPVPQTGSVSFVLADVTPSSAFAPVDPIRIPTNLREGEQLYLIACAACHGQDGAGVEGLGSPLIETAFVQERTEQELLDMIRTGRASDAPDNQTGVSMPPRGGRTDLTDEQILAIIRFLREGR